jgi:hypothetical protein
VWILPVSALLLRLRGNVPASRRSNTRPRCGQRGLRSWTERNSGRDRARLRLLFQLSPLRAGRVSSRRSLTAMPRPPGSAAAPSSWRRASAAMSRSSG